MTLTLIGINIRHQLQLVKADECIITGMTDYEKSDELNQENGLLENINSSEIL